MATTPSQWVDLPVAQKSDDDDELRIDVREIGELFWIDVHQQQLVGRRPRHRFTGELGVEITHVAISLLRQHHHVISIVTSLSASVQGRGDGPKADTSGAGDKPRDPTNPVLP